MDSHHIVALTGMHLTAFDVSEVDTEIRAYFE